jgi:RNA polymerase sigma-70 factor (ECF subfamily)
MAVAAGTRTEEEFRALAGHHRDALEAHCYRMLGSLGDSEDAVEQTLLRAWRTLDGFDGDATALPRLYRIATNVCLDELERRPRRLTPPDLTGPADPLVPVAPPLESAPWLEPYFGAEDEGIELGFIAAVHHLAPRQRAVLLLRHVLGFSAEEAAEVVDDSVASVNGALVRARMALDQRVANARALTGGEVEHLVMRWAEAWEAGDVEEIAELLTADAWLTMPPSPSWYSGREAIAAFLSAQGLAERQLRATTLEANSQPAVALYELDVDAGAYVPLALHVLEAGEDGVRHVAAFGDTALFERFSLPA